MPVLYGESKIVIEYTNEKYNMFTVMEVDKIGFEFDNLL